ncbi:MAG: hypothetical protein JWM21_3717 [Acidobacteria bacterium]|nr:hypothetical protein [Acidobacteriota bacterium]
MSADPNQPNEGARRRIVIPLGQQQGGSPARARGKGDNPKAVPGPRRSRLSKILAVLGIAVVAVVLLTAAGIFFWWQHYKTTPSYSLALLVDAAQRNDMATVDTIIDTDKVVANFAGQLTDKAAGRYGVALGDGMRKQIESLTPKLLPSIKEVTRTAMVARVKELSQQANQKPFILVALGMPYLVNVATSGDTAKAVAVVRDQRVELDLARAGEGWKVVAFRDDALVQQAVDQVIKSLPVIGADNATKKSGAHRNRGVLPSIPELRLP